MRFSRTVRRSAVAGALLSGALVLGAVPGAAFADPTTPSAHDVQQAQQDAAQRAADVGQVQSQLAALSAQLDQINANAEIAFEAFNGAEVKLKAAQAAADAAAAAERKAEAEVDTQRKVMDRFAAVSFTTGGQFGQFASLLSSSGPSDFIDRATTLDQLSRQQSEAMTAMRAALLVQHSASEQRKQALAGVQKAADLATAARDRAKAQVQSQQAAVAAVQAQQSRLQAELAAAQAKASNLASARASGLARQAAAAAAARQAQLDAARRAAAAAAAAAGSGSSGSSASSGSSGSAGSSGGGPATYSSGGVSRSTAAQGLAAVQAAKRWIGTPYCWGGGDANGPTQGQCAPAAPGFDCSGLTLYAWAQAGIRLDHWTGYQWNEGQHIPVSQARPGDLFFYATNTSDPDTIHHVGLYIGNGQMIEAPYTGAYVRYANPYRPDLIGVVRP